MSKVTNFLKERNATYKSITGEFLKSYESKLNTVVSMLIDNHTTIQWSDIYAVNDDITIVMVIAENVVFNTGEEANIAIYTQVDTLENGSASEIKDEHLILQSAEQNMTNDEFNALVESKETFETVKKNLNARLEKVVEVDDGDVIEEKKTITREQYNKLQAYVSIHGLNEEIKQ